MTSRTQGKRPDYRELHNTGNLVSIDTGSYHSEEPISDIEIVGSIHATMSSEEDETKPDLFVLSTITKLTCQAEALADDITDFIDENLPNTLSSIEDIDSVIKRIEERQSGYRTKHRELQLLLGKEYSEDTRTSYNETLGLVKDYIKEIQMKRKALREGEDSIKRNAILVKDEKLVFLRKEIQRIMVELESTFNEDISEESNEDITKRKKEYPDQNKKVDTISKYIQQVIELGEKAAEVKTLKDRYERIIEVKETYYNNLNSEDKSREIEKQKSFNKSTLGINFGKFKGYSSNLDIYSFKDQFEKVHLRETPKSLLPDLLKNNFLEEPALSLVKNVTDIDDIWKRLKDAYGDCKIMLSNKLAEFSSIGDMWKQRDPLKTVDALSKIINLMRDLLQLAKRHKIENNLFFGGAIDNVYHLMGHARLNRWLLNVGDDEQGESQWLELLEFLEKELKVAQQHANIMASQPKKQTKDFKDPASKRTFPTYNVGGSNNNINKSPHNDGLCTYCGESGHVQTNGPGGMKLVQYFACKQFADASCAQRLSNIQSKGFCIQCLFPGANSGQGKHKEGRCQRDFVCPHPSHSRFTVKKHVLLCDDHKDTSENKEILEKYKSRCILRPRNTDLPTYAKEIHLSHYCSSPIMTVPSPKKKHEEPKKETKTKNKQT